MQVAQTLKLKVYVEADKWAVFKCLELPSVQRSLLTRNINEAGIHVMPMCHVRRLCASQSLTSRSLPIQHAHAFAADPQTVRSIRSCRKHASASSVMYNQHCQHVLLSQATLVLQLTAERLEARCVAHGGFSHVIAFRPTGWTFNSKQGGGATAAAGAAPTAALTHAKPGSRECASAAQVLYQQRTAQQTGTHAGADFANRTLVPAMSNALNHAVSDTSAHARRENASSEAHLQHVEEAVAAPQRNAFAVLTNAPARAAARAAKQQEQELKQSNGLAYLMGSARKRARDAQTRAELTQSLPAWLPAPRVAAGGHVKTYAVPYSEHSSFAELREFVRWLQPVAVVPTVNRGDNGQNVASMLRALAAD